jgi:hypothetical protein
MSSRLPSDVDWRDVKREIDLAVDRIWLEEPEEITRIRSGVFDRPVGNGDEYFSILVHLESYLMIVGEDVIFRFAQVAEWEDLDLAVLKRMTRTFLMETFNLFAFLGDLGLGQLEELGKRYDQALDSVESREEYIELTSSLLTYVNRMRRWVHLIFPWNLGAAFPKRRPP